MTFTKELIIRLLQLLVLALMAGERCP
jgi:hypothetical protein